MKLFLMLLLCSSLYGQKVCQEYHITRNKSYLRPTQYYLKFNRDSIKVYLDKLSYSFPVKKTSVTFDCVRYKAKKSVIYLYHKFAVEIKKKKIIIYYFCEKSNRFKILYNR